MQPKLTSQSAAPALNLPDHLHQKLLKQGKPRSYEKGELVHQAGEIATSMSIVQTGRVSLFTMTGTGKSGTGHILSAGAAFGLFPLIAQRPRSHNCEAVERSSLVHISLNDVWRLIDNEADIRRDLFSYLCIRLSMTFEAINAERYLTLTQRLALRLDEFADDKSVVSLTQQEIADHLGVSRVAIGNALKRLVAKDLIRLGYGRIELRNRSALRQESELIK